NHHSLGFTSFPLGSCNMGWMVWDSMRAVDYLLTRPDVDGERIGITGASGGGANSFYAAAVDERLRASVVVVFACTFLEWFRYGGDNCICDHLPEFMGHFEEFEIFSMLAPRPVLLLNSIPDDGYPVSGARVSFQAAQQIYRLAGASGQIDYRELPTPHGYLQPEREAMYGWFDHYLQGSGSGAAEKEETCEPEPVGSEALQCFKDHLPTNAKTMIAFNRETYESLRPQSGRATPELRQKLIEMLGGFPEKTPLYGIDRTSSKAGVSEPRSLVFRSETGIALPAFLLLSHANKAKGTVIYMHPQGKEWVLGNQLSTILLQSGLHVLAVDVRGLGETGRYAGERGYPDEFQCCTDSAALGKPILQQRVWDVIRTLDYLEEIPLTRGLRVLAYGEGVCGNITLFAAALDQRIAAVATTEALLSYRPAMQEIHDKVELYNAETSELVTAEARIHYSLYVPGILKVSDLPEIYDLISPRKILAANPLTPEDFADIRNRIPGLAIFQKLTEPQLSREVAHWLREQAS
ncbi:MAG TPA: acetylxylan esterase, partial [Candidatus Binatia bacterium]|nr:acetylxylan esterase [Candidatus Binatia bacterium]